MQNGIMTKSKAASKCEGSSIYIMAPIIFFLIMVLFYVNNYIRAADTVSDNFKTSLDAATLSATVVDVDKMLLEGRLNILGKVEDSGTLTDYENQMAQKRFVTFERALQGNVGLTDNFSFRGGTCGWAAEQISSGSLIIETFIIYDLTETNVYSYTISNIAGYTETPAVVKSLMPIGTVTRNADGNVVSSTARTPDGTLVTDPTVYAKVSFPVEPLNITDIDWVDYSEVRTDADVQAYMNGIKRVSRTSITSLKIGDDDGFNMNNGNGWF